ncbi:MAG TPA: SDR family NAD(P)-dependent oxidoreductase [Jatrophihabitans sp.]|nr:SDR family NAD(P)-dependent oxidoreductase [Jatrophihabitans sp.]
MPQQRTALVTGAGRGIGRAVAGQLCQHGLRVVVAARRYADAEAVAAELGALPVPLDVTSPDSVRQAADRLGSVDVLVSNAGVLLEDGTADPLTASLEVVEQTLAVNLLGAWRVAQAFVPGMVERGWGRVVFVSSGTGSFTAGIFGGSPGYSVSKTGLNALTQMLARRTEGTGVLVNAVNPGPTRTRMMPFAQRSPEEAAGFVVAAALLPDDGPTGTLRRGEQEFGW